LRTTSAPISPFSTSADLEEAVGAGATVGCRLVAAPAERELHLRIRAEVFVGEQGLFAVTDADAHDDDAGTVRLYPLDEPGLWKGDRLAVLPAFRKHGLGAPLVRFAVRTAGERGGQEMLAQVQVANVAFFEHLGWRRLGDPADYCGRPHQQMRIALRR